MPENYAGATSGLLILRLFVFMRMTGTLILFWASGFAAITHTKFCHISQALLHLISTFQDFPYPLKLWNTYRTRAFGYWYGTICGNPVYNNVRWGTPETYGYCFDGLPKHDVVVIGTVGGSPRKKIDRPRFEQGLNEMVRVLHPHTIIVAIVVTR